MPPQASIPAIKVDVMDHPVPMPDQALSGRWSPVMSAGSIGGAFRLRQRRMTPVSAGQSADGLPLVKTFTSVRPGCSLLRGGTRDSLATLEHECEDGEHEAGHEDRGPEHEHLRRDPYLDGTVDPQRERHGATGDEVRGDEVVDREREREQGAGQDPREDQG